MGSSKSVAAPSRESTKFPETSLPRCWATSIGSSSMVTWIFLSNCCTTWAFSQENLGIHVRRDDLVSVMYSAELNSATSSITRQRTDQHGILAEKSPDIQLFW